MIQFLSFQLYFSHTLKIILETTDKKQQGFHIILLITCDVNNSNVRRRRDISYVKFKLHVCFYLLFSV